MKILKLLALIFHMLSVRVRDFIFRAKCLKILFVIPVKISKCYYWCDAGRYRLWEIQLFFIEQ